MREKWRYNRFKKKIKNGGIIMKFYIGSGFKNCELVNYYSKVLEEKGWHHTYNWAKNINNGISIKQKGIFMFCY